MSTMTEENKTEHWKETIFQRATELDSLYKEFNLYPKNLGAWTEKHLEGISISNFRSDNVYVWQKRNISESNILISFLITKLLDNANLFDLIKESREFGVEVYEFLGVSVSRDLLDSILEINFLIDIVGLENFKTYKILDIGAGYGRLSKSLAQAFPMIKSSCIDSIPLSTAISEFYLEKEIVDKKVKVYTLDQIDQMPDNYFDLATNIHSFSEMSLDSVENWIKLLKDLNVPKILVIPNAKELKLDSGEDLQIVFEKYGYFIKSKRHKYSNSVDDKHLMYPSNYFYLELKTEIEDKL